MAVAMTGGDVQLAGARPELLQSALDVLTQIGAVISVNNEGIRVAATAPASCGDGFDRAVSRLSD